jgi:hypothetical protein
VRRKKGTGLYHVAWAYVAGKYWPRTHIPAFASARLTHGHALVFAVLQLTHRTFLRFQFRQRTREVTLVQAAARVFALFPALAISHPLITPPAHIQARIGLGLHGPDHRLALEPPLALIATVMRTDAAIDVLQE